jgi:hypothetical protein
LNGLKEIIDNNANTASTDLINAIAGTAVNPAVSTLGQNISSTQAQVPVIQYKLNELISAITRPAA